MESRPTPDLRRYSSAAASELTDRLRADLAAGLIEAGYVESRLQFRDPSGQTWSPGLRSGRWYRHATAAWIPESSPPATLEGPADWSRLLPVAKDVRMPVPESEVATQVGGRSGLAAVQQAAERLKDGYEAGSVTSAEATALLEELALAG